MLKAVLILRKRELIFSMVIAMIFILPAIANAYPAAGTDVFGSILTHTLELYDPVFPGGHITTLELKGFTVVERGDPYDPSDGKVQIDTEIVSMNLTSSDPGLGSIIVTQSGSLDSTGKIKQQTAGIDFPAESFFDVFFEIELPDIPMILENHSAAHMTSIINAIPPIGDLYILQEDVDIYVKGDTSNQVIGKIWAGATHQPIPEPTTMLLLGTGLVGLAGFRRKKFKK